MLPLEVVIGVVSWCDRELWAHRWNSGYFFTAWYLARSLRAVMEGK